MFPENYLIEGFASVCFWSMRLLAAWERMAKGDRDIKVEILENTQDGFGPLCPPGEHQLSH